MLITLRSLWVWTAIATLILLALPALLVRRLFDRDPAYYPTGRLFRRIGAWATRTNTAWEIDVVGELPDDPRRPYVVVCNHQSLADIPIICLLPWEMKWVVKAELLRLPIFGWLLRLSGDIPVDRQDKNSRGRVVDRARDYLQKRCSVMFFPEGTRSRDGRVLRFTNGAFRVAIQEQAPILPLVIDGTSDALPKNTWRFDHTSDIRLKVLPPIETTGLTEDDATDLREQVRDRIIEELAAWRGVPREAVDARAPKQEVKPSAGS